LAEASLRDQRDGAGLAAGASVTEVVVAVVETLGGGAGWGGGSGWVIVPAPTP
jgi:hypothetical protein